MIESLLRASCVPEYVMAILRRAHDAGLGAWIVGGAVRDLLRGVAPGEWDVATTGGTDDLQRVFPGAIPTGIRHGTVTILSNGASVEVTCLRGEGAYQNGRHPSEVEFGVSLERDLARRDFTINAMAWDALADSDPTGPVDPFGGMADLQAGVLRTVGDPLERFREDGLRTLRAVRFTTTLGLKLDSATAAALGAAEARATLARVAWERRRDELTKILLARRPSVGLSLLERTRLLDELIPELRDSVGCTQNRWHAFDVWEHTVQVVEAADPTEVSRWSALLHDVGKPASRAMGKRDEPTFHSHERIGAPMAAAILERMRVPAALRERVRRLVRHHIIAYRPGWRDAAVRRFVSRVGRDLVDDLVLLARADALGKGRPVRTELALLDELAQRVAEADRANAAFTVGELAVGGREVMETMGIPPGPEVGRVLSRLLAHVLEHPEHNTPEALTTLLKRWSGE